MNNEEKILAMLEQMQGDISGLKQGQAGTNARLDGMDKRLDSIEAGQQAMQEDIDQIKEDTAVTRDVVNGVSEWTEIASDVLRIPYPLPIKE